MWKRYKTYWRDFAGGNDHWRSALVGILTLTCLMIAIMIGIFLLIYGINFVVTHAMLGWFLLGAIGLTLLIALIVALTTDKPTEGDHGAQNRNR
jgi:hypothetical protein